MDINGKDFNIQNSTFRNCILGGALGDALGFLVELDDVKTIQAFAERLQKHNPETLPEWLKSYMPKDWITGQSYPCGQVSDDTQLTLMLHASLMEGGKENYNELFKQNLVNAFKGNEIISHGYTTKEVALCYGEGNPLPEKAFQSTSNGSVMRIAPLGIYFKDDLNVVAREASLHSQITHLNEVCQTACQAQALAVALVVRRIPLSTLEDKLKFIDNILEFLPENPSKKLYGQIKELIPLPIREAEQKLLQIDSTVKADRQGGGISMHAMTCTMWAHLCLLNSPQDYWSVITNTLHIGGDVDTVASIAGSLAGIYNGKNSFPEWGVEFLS